MNKAIADLSPHIGSEEYALLGFDRGLKLRKDSSLDNLKKHLGEVTVVFPDHVHTIDAPFMEGLLFEVAFYRGSVAIEKLWTFEMPGAANIADVVRRALARVMDKRAAFG